MVRGLAGLIVGSGLLAAAGAARALPVLLVDLDPDAAGVQAEAVALPGESREVVVVVLDAVGLHAFQLELGFDPAVAAARALAGGGFLAEPTDVVQAELDPAALRYAETTLGEASVSGDGVLLRFALDALAVGDSELVLREVILSAPFGVAIPVGALLGGLLRVVPEPTSAALLAGGLLALAAARRRLRG